MSANAVFLTPGEGETIFSVNSAPIKFGAGALGARIGIGDVLGDDAHAPGLAAQAGGGDGDALDQVHDQRPFPIAIFIRPRPLL